MSGSLDEESHKGPARVRPPRWVHLVLATVLVAAALAECAPRDPTENELVAFEQALFRFPEVAAVDVALAPRQNFFNTSRLMVEIDLRPGTSPDRSAAIVRVAADQRRNSPFADVGDPAGEAPYSGAGAPYIVISLGEGKTPLFRSGTEPLVRQLQMDLNLPVEILEAETRIWHDLRRAFSTASMHVTVPHRREVTVATTSDRLPTDAVVRTYQILTDITPPQPETTWWEVSLWVDMESTWYVSLRLDPERFHTVPGTGLPPDPLVATMQEVADVAALAPPGSRFEVRGSWLQNRDTGAGCLLVSSVPALPEFEGLSDDQIRARLPGSATEQLGAEYLERLETSGLEFGLGVRTGKNNPVVEVDRCSR